MKITVHRDRLQRALGFVERVTSRNATLPILSNILVGTEAGRLRVSATNLEIGVSSLIGAKVDTEGKVAVPARTILDFIRGVRDETVYLELKQNTLSVKAGRYHTTILCFDAAEYPIIPKVEGGQIFTISAGDLRALIATITDSIAASDSRPELAGAFLKFQPDEVIMAATDIFRLAERKIPGTYSGTAAAIIPRGAVHELARILADVDGDVSVRITENQVAFDHEEFNLVSRLIDGRYPEYRKIIPERSLARMLVRKDDVENAAKVTSLFSSSISDIKFECQDGELKVSAKNSSKGEATAGIEANLKGEAFEVSMNYHYLLDGLKVMTTEKLVLEFTGKGSPFVIRPNGDEGSVVYLIMPLRN